MAMLTPKEINNAIKNQRYWNNRISNEIWESYNLLEDKNQAIIQMYQTAEEEIDKELLRLYRKPQSRTTRSDNYEKARLEGVKKQLQLLSQDLEKHYNDGATEGVESLYNTIMAELGVADFTVPNTAVIKHICNNKWQGSDFSHRLWKQNGKLQKNLNQILKGGIMRGATVTEMALKLEARMHNELYNSMRLVRTETMHALNMGAIKAYADAGVQEVIFYAAADERTCSYCGNMHGKKINIKDILTYPPLHPHCRCTVVPVVETIRK